VRFPLIHCVCVALALLCGCAGSGTTELATTDGLPPFPAGRAASLVTLTADGSAAYAASPSALATGDDMLIPSTSGGYNWATYELRPNDSPLVLEVWLKEAQTTEAWVALADFAEQRWELRGPVQRWYDRFQLSLDDFFAGLRDGGFKGYVAYEICSPIRGGGTEANLDAACTHALKKIRHWAG